MKKISTLAVLVVFAIAAQSQSYTKTITTPFYINANRLINTKDGGWMTIGTSTTSFGDVYGNDFYIVKFKANGNVDWSKSYGANTKLPDYALSATITKDTGYLISGSSTDATGKSLGAVLRIDSLGNKLWCKTFSDTLPFSIVSAVQIADGGYVCGGNLVNGNNLIPVLIKLSASGSVINYKKIKIGASAVFRKIIAGDNGDLVMLLDDGQSFSNNKKLIVIRTTKNEVIKWSKRFSGGYSDIGRDIIETRDKGFAITGGSTYVKQGSANYLSFTTKTDSVGNVLWRRSINEGDRQGSVPMSGYSILENADKSLVSCGDVASSYENVSLVNYSGSGTYISSTILPVPTMFSTSPSYGRGLIKIKSGYVIAAEQNDNDIVILKANNAFVFCESQTALSPTIQDSAIVLDSINASFVNQTGITDMDNLIVIDLATKLQTKCPIDSFAEATSTEKCTLPVINIYPNPVVNYINVAFNTNKTGKALLQVYDVAGNNLLEVQANTTVGRNIKILNTSALHRGMYKLVLLNNGIRVTQSFYKQ